MDSDTVSESGSGRQKCPHPKKRKFFEELNTYSLWMHDLAWKSFTQIYKVIYRIFQLSVILNINPVPDPDLDRQKPGSKSASGFNEF
jgi:hypothetical protein